MSARFAEYPLQGRLFRTAALSATCSSRQRIRWYTLLIATNTKQTVRFLSALAASVLGTFIAVALVMFVGFMFFAALLATTASTSTVPRAGSVLEIQLSGAVPELASNDPIDQVLKISPAFDLPRLKAGLKRAATDNRIEAVWLRTHGIAASWGTLQEIRQALIEYKESGKPLIASSGESFITERDYFLASAADEVYAAPGSFFEFNGLYAQTFYYKGLLDKLDIEPTIVRAGSFKSAVEPFMRTDMSEESRLQLQTLLQTHSEVLTTAIAESRSTTPDHIERLMRDEAFITVDDGHRVGLVDSLLFDEAVEDAIKDRIGTASEDALKTISLGAYASSAAPANTGTEGTIGIVYAVGAIVSGESNVAGGTVGSSTFGKAMQSVRDKDDVKAVVLRINSPGGSAIASNAMWQEIDKTAAVKPVVVSMGDLAASGGYWIATAGDTIVADPTTLTGSIGVFGMHFNVGEMLESKLGVTTDRVATSDYADMFSGMRPLRSEEQAMLARVIDATYSDFLNLVAESRGLDVDAVHAIAQGRVWTGADAMDIGLVDVLGGMDTAIGIAAEQGGLDPGTFRLLRLPQPKSFMDELEDALLMRVGRLLRLSVAPPLVLEPHATLIDEVVRMHGTPQSRMLLDITIK